MNRFPVVLFSGGMDSTVACHLARASCGGVNPLFIDYGQPAARAESYSTAIWSGRYNHHLARLEVRLPGAADLLSGGGAGSPRVVPGRNVVLLSHAVAYACAIGSGEVWIGATGQDRQDYPDCRAAFIQSMSDAAQGAYGVRINAPLSGMTKAQAFILGHRIGACFEHVMSCYQPGPGYAPCNNCRSCSEWSAAQRANIDAVANSAGC